MTTVQHEPLVVVPSGRVELEGVLEVPHRSKGIVVFAHGSGSSRHSPRNVFVAQRLREAGLATLLIDLLTAQEDEAYETRFDIGLLAVRLGDAARFVERDPRVGTLPLGLFGASTGAAAALRVAAEMPAAIAAVVSRGGRADLAGDAVLESVRAPTLLIVGGRDHAVIELNKQARGRLAGKSELVVVPGASHLFEEPGALENVARLAADWFECHFDVRRQGR